MTREAPQEKEPYIKPANHYIDNKKFLAALVEYRKGVVAAKAIGEEIPPCTEYIGECFLKIAQHLSYKANFINYSYRDEMISDAIENCLTCVSNFDPEKSENPFAYFTQVSYFAFIRRIQKEQKQTKTKLKMLESIDIDSIVAQEGDSEVASQFADHMRKMFDTMTISNNKGID